MKFAPFQKQSFPMPGFPMAIVEVVPTDTQTLAVLVVEVPTFTAPPVNIAVAPDPLFATFRTAPVDDAFCWLIFSTLLLSEQVLDAVHVYAGFETSKTSPVTVTRALAEVLEDKTLREKTTVAPVTFIIEASVPAT